ncbi:NlpC/P60 family protein [Domibacillus sp. A3M-37]|uniref:C40 family peptidase n=1 Tax=Domibacillus sp. A3M-37 TaxID=2962037 RepID=UPI0020B82A1B|nr:C40 family peptidase [Domibacillus sp. A3M-37]MCP3762267.1 NlpC/P60 family protein [Domibacillus sp. A3M-37]
MTFKKVMMAIMLCVMAFSLVPPAAKAADPATCYAKTPAKKTYINVSVATLWKEPGTKRQMDQHVLSNPVNMKAWTSKMTTVKDRLWLTGKAETQALYGQEVTVLKTSGSWAQVAVKDQSTPKNSKGYPGWLPKAQVTTQPAAYEACETAGVKSNTAVLFQDKKTSFMELSFNTELPIIKSETNWVQVMTPANGAKWLKKGDIRILAATPVIPKPIGTALLTTGKQFLGLPYLWSGVSSYGYDCSGFTSSVYRYHGISIPRDASDQAKKGKAIAKSSLKPGDLLFFAYNNGKGRVHHVAMYAGNGQMIHSPKAGKRVEIISMNTAPYKQEYAGARRYTD